MKILALDSSGLVASAAIVEDDVLIAEYTTDYKKTHSQTLLPMLDEIRQMIDLELHTIDAIAISAGPGSFTGLRIGAATAKGLGLALPQPHYVCAKHMAQNEVVLGLNEDLFTRELDAFDINLIPYEQLNEPIRVKAKVRYRHTEQWATVTQTDTDRLHIVFDEPQRAITPGQAVVLYDGDYVIGGGTICANQEEL